MKPIVKIVMSFLLCTLFLILMCACKNAGENSVTSTGNASGTNVQSPDNMISGDFSTNETASGGKDTVTDIGNNSNNEIIETPYLNLTFDSALSDHLHVVHHFESPYVLEFYAVLDNKPLQRLFDIRFSKETSTAGKKIRSMLGEVYVSTVFHSFTPDDSWTTDEINTVLAMQEVLNQLVDQIQAHQIEADYEETPSSNDVPESNITKNIEIVTPFCILNCPEQWENYLKVDHVQGETYTLNFYATLEEKTPILLFSLIFGGDDGDQLGAIKNSQGEYIPVNIVMGKVELSNYDDEDMTIIYEMQEGVNSLIEQMSLE